MKLLCTMFICHFIADFLLQSREMGKTKSEKLSMLFKHVLIQGIVLFFPLYFMIGYTAIKIALINSIVHGVVDWYIWKVYKISAGYRIKNNIDKHLYCLLENEHRSNTQWKYYEDHWFYATIGFDQLLHGLTLIILAYLFT